MNSVKSFGRPISMPQPVFATGSVRNLPLQCGFAPTRGVPPCTDCKFPDVRNDSFKC